MKKKVPTPKPKLLDQITWGGTIIPIYEPTTSPAGKPWLKFTILLWLLGATQAMNTSHPVHVPNGCSVQLSGTKYIGNAAPKSNTTINWATECWCHRGQTMCNGCVNTSTGIVGVDHRHDEVCVTYDSLCEGHSAGCHEVHEHGEFPWLLYVIISLLCWVVVTVMMFRVCTKKRGTYRAPRKYAWCNPVLLLLVIMFNKTYASLLPGECSNGTCLLGCYDSGPSIKIGSSWESPKFTPKSGAWCTNRDCCQDASHEATVYKCSRNHYGWTTGCFLVGKGCNWCGFKIEGTSSTVYEMRVSKRKCLVTKQGNKFWLDVTHTPANKLYSPEMQCVANTPHLADGVHRYTGGFSCNCPDPWHCGVSGGISFGPACKTKTTVSCNSVGCSLLDTEPVQLSTILPKCDSTRTTVPCQTDSTVCLTSKCEAAEGQPHGSFVQTLWENHSTFTEGWGLNGWLSNLKWDLIVAAIVTFLVGTIGVLVYLLLKTK